MGNHENSVSRHFFSIHCLLSNHVSILMLNRHENKAYPIELTNHSESMKHFELVCSREKVHLNQC